MTALLRRLVAAGGLLGAVLILPAGLVLATQAAPWPNTSAIPPAPLHSGEFGEFAWPDFRDWMIATYHEIRLQLPADEIIVLIGLIVLWSLWAVLIGCLAVDALALVRHGAHRIRTDRPRGVRGWITTLLTSAVLVSTTATSTASPLPPHPVAASAPRHPQGPHPAPNPQAAPDTDPHPASRTSVSSPAVWVHRGDTLWTLAAEHLGDGTRWREITDLNPQLAPEPQLLAAGQWLRLPSNARPQPTTPTPDTRWITVQPGDTLASLAAAHLGDAQHWRALFDHNRGRTQPDDRTLRDPDILLPGWRLALPPDTPAQPAEDPPPEPDSHTSTPAPPHAGHATPTPAPDTDPTHSAPAPPTDPDASSMRVEAGIVLGLAAAGCLAAAYQWHRRRPARTPTTTLPAVYSLPIALHPRHQEPDPDDSAPDAALLGTPASSTPGQDAEETPAGDTPVRPWTAPTTPEDASAAEPASPGQQAEAASPDTAPAPATRPALALEEAATSTAHAEPMIEHPTPAAAAAPLRLAVFGPVRLTRQSDQSPAGEVALQPRMRGLLALLALTPHGTGRDEIREALWGERVSGTSALNTTVSRLRRALADQHPTFSELITTDDGRYRLDPALATVDYWEFTTALQDRRRATTHDQRAAADEQVITTYTGEFAAGLDAPWAEPIRAHAHRAFLDAITARTRALQHTDPHRVLGMLEAARDLAPHHEPLYRNIMRLQAHLDLHEAIPNTLALLRTRLADLGTTPDNRTLALHDQLLQRGRS